MPDAEKGRQPDEWPVTWAAHCDDQLDRVLASSPVQRLAWLEEMIRLAFLTGAFSRRECK